MLDSNGSEIVTAFAAWIRQGSNVDEPPTETDVGSTENPAADPTKIDILERGVDFRQSRRDVVSGSSRC